MARISELLEESLQDSESLSDTIDDLDDRFGGLIEDIQSRSLREGDDEDEDEDDDEDDDEKEKKKDDGDDDEDEKEKKKKDDDDDDDEDEDEDDDDDDDDDDKNGNGKWESVLGESMSAYDDDSMQRYAMEVLRGMQRIDNRFRYGYVGGSGSKNKLFFRYGREAGASGGWIRASKKGENKVRVEVYMESRKPASLMFTSTADIKKVHQSPVPKKIVSALSKKGSLGA